MVTFRKIIPLISLLLLLVACKGTDVIPLRREGIITGYDPRMCPTPACGGLDIIIKNDTAKNPPPFYHINATLQQLGINASTPFPINVDLNYKPDTGIYTKYNYILVTQIKVVN